MSHRSAFVILAKLLEPTRLEKRTTHVRVFGWQRNESDSRHYDEIAVRSVPCGRLHDRPVASSVSHESRSMFVRIRKMVNYA